MTCLLSAYTAQNLGDDMFVDYICRRYPVINFIMVCDEKYNAAFLKIPNLKLYDNLNHLLCEENTIDIQVLIGGSLFMQPQNQAEICNKYLENKKLRIFNDIPMVIVGSNFGPYDADKHYLLYKKWFTTINHISFRDEYSYKLFKNLQNTIWAPDVLLNYPVPTISKSNKIAISCIRDDSRIGLPKYNEEDYFTWLVKVAKSYICQGYSILLTSFCKKQGDTLAAQIIQSRLPSNTAQILEYEGNIENFLSKFLSAEFIIGTRFHSIILGWLSNIPVFPIAYNSKISNMLECYNFTGNFLNIQDCSSYNFEYVDYNRQMNIALPEQSLIENAKKHFQYLDTFFSAREGL